MASDQLYGSSLNSEIDLTAPIKNNPKRVAISDDELLLPKFARLADLSFMFESFMNEAESNCLLAELYDTYSCLQKSSIII